MRWWGERVGEGDRGWGGGLGAGGGIRTQEFKG